MREVRERRHEDVPNYTHKDARCTTTVCVCVYDDRVSINSNSSPRNLNEHTHTHAGNVLLAAVPRCDSLKDLLHHKIESFDGLDFGVLWCALAPDGERCIN